MEGFLQETPAWLGILDSVDWQNLYLNTLVGFDDLLWLLWHGKTYNLFFLNGALYVPLKSPWHSVVSWPLLVNLWRFFDMHDVRKNLRLLIFIFCMLHDRIFLGN